MTLYEKLCFYLPYNLKIVAPDYPQLDLIMHPIGGTGYIGINEVVQRPNLYKPALKPMSDFNKVMDLYNYPVKESILSYINIAKNDEYTYHPKLNCLRLNSSIGYQQWNFKTGGQLELPFRIVQLLIQNNFDIFNMIESGEAYDLNNLPKYEF